MYLGTIEMDSVKTITSKMVVYDTGKPVLYLSAIVGKEKIVMDGRGYECGTYLKTFTEGEFKWNLVLFPVANGKNFLLVNADKGSR